MHKAHIRATSNGITQKQSAQPTTIRRQPRLRDEDDDDDDGDHKDDDDDDGDDDAPTTKA